ncbi:hypothetical protein Tco_0708184 [Tanacetum coccineum]
MFKWVWRFRTQGSSLWAKVIKGIHGENGKLDRNTNSEHPSIWLDIVREEDVWRGDISFKYLYPRLFALETSQLSHLIENIEGVSLSNVSDQWVWALDGKGEFSVASVRRLIDDSSLPVISSKTRWVNMVPIKINIHAWKNPGPAALYLPTYGNGTPN